MWELPSGRPLQTLTGHSGGVSALAFSSDGRLLGSGSTEPMRSIVQVFEWDTRTWARVREHRINDLRARTLSLAPGLKRVAIARDGDYVELRDLTNDRWLGVLKDMPRNALRLGFSPDGSRLAVTHYEYTLFIWDAETRKGTGEYRDPVRQVECAAFSPDHRLIASGGYGRSLVVRELESGKAVANLTVPMATVTALCFSPDSRTLAIGGAGGRTALWSVPRHAFLGSLFAFATGRSADSRPPDWLAVTTDGFYDRSQGAGDYFRWRVGAQLFPAETYDAFYRRPELVRKALGG